MQYLRSGANQKDDTLLFSVLRVWIFFISGVIAVLGDTPAPPVRVTDFCLFCLIIQLLSNLLPSLFLLPFCVVVLSVRREVETYVLAPPDN